MSELSTDWQPVTLRLLADFYSLLNSDKERVTTYGDVLKVVEFLEENGVVDLELSQNPGDTHRIYRIKKV